MLDGSLLRAASLSIFFTFSASSIARCASSESLGCVDVVVLAHSGTTYFRRGSLRTGEDADIRRLGECNNLFVGCVLNDDGNGKANDVEGWAVQSVCGLLGDVIAEVIDSNAVL